MDHTEDFEGCRITVHTENQGNRLIEVVYGIDPLSDEVKARLARHVPWTPGSKTIHNLRPEGGTPFTEADAVKFGVAGAQWEIRYRLHD